jgi:hypothetical protein
LDALDLELLSMIASAQDPDNPDPNKGVSTWQLASQHAKTSLDKNKLDGVYRYRLEQLRKKRLVRKRIVTRGKQKITVFMLNPQKFVCVDSSVIILSDPITILACPYQNKCKEKLNQHFPITKCRLFQKAPANIQQLIRDNLKQGKVIHEGIASTPPVVT